MRFFLALLLAAPGTAAEISLPTFITSNMVLQMAPMKARIWGNATAGTTVKIQINGAIAHEGQATAKADGSWSVDLDPREASPSNKVVIVPGSGDALTLTNVAFGDGKLLHPTCPCHVHGSQRYQSPTLVEQPICLLAADTPPSRACAVFLCSG